MRLAPPFSHGGVTSGEDRDQLTPVAEVAERLLREAFAAQAG